MRLDVFLGLSVLHEVRIFNLLRVELLLQLLDDIGLSETVLVKLSLDKRGKLFSSHILLKESFNEILNFDVLILFHRAHNTSTEVRHLLALVWFRVDSFLNCFLFIGLFDIISLFVLVCLVKDLEELLNFLFVITILKEFLGLHI